MLRWVNLTESIFEVSLVLRSVYFGVDSQINQLPKPVVIAAIRQHPSVTWSEQRIDADASELRIHGTGFIGAKKVEFVFFDPNLQKGIVYDDVSKYPLKENQVILKLRNGQKWSDSYSQLRLTGVDTGGGVVKTSGITFM